MALTLLFLGALLTSQVLAECTDNEAVSSLDEDKLLGKWYVGKQTIVDDWPGRSQLTCPRKVFNRSSDGNLNMVFHVYNTTSSSYVSYGNTMQKANESSTDGRYVALTEGRSYQYNVVAINDNYSLVRTCGKMPNSEDVFVSHFLMTRESIPGTSVPEEATALLPTGSYADNNHTDCPED